MTDQLTREEFEFLQTAEEEDMEQYLPLKHAVHLSLLSVFSKNIKSLAKLALKFGWFEVNMFYRSAISTVVTDLVCCCCRRRCYRGLFVVLRLNTNAHHTRLINHFLDQFAILANHLSCKVKISISQSAGTV